MLFLSFRPRKEIREKISEVKHKSTKHSYRWRVKNRDYCTDYFSYLNRCCRILFDKLKVTPSALTVYVCFGPTL